MTEHWYFVADIGGTNARFAAFHGARMMETAVYDTKQGDDLLEMARDFTRSAFPEPPLVAVAAAAGPVKDNALQLTNANASLSGDDLGHATGAKQAKIINDFAAAAWSTLAVGPGDISRISGAEAPGPATRLVIGPGTGLGVGVLVCADGAYHSVSGEGGHIGASPRSRYEVEVFAALRTLWPDIFFGDTLVIEAEGILSGTGLPYLYQAVQNVEGADGPVPDPRGIFEGARNESDPVAIKTIGIFKAHLGQIAGDLALAFGASGGVYLVGGIAMKNPWMFDAPFVTAFTSGGRFTKEREVLPLYLVNEPNFGLIGAYKYVETLVSA